MSQFFSFIFRCLIRIFQNVPQIFRQHWTSAHTHRSSAFSHSIHSNLLKFLFQLKSFKIRTKNNCSSVLNRFSCNEAVKPHNNHKQNRFETCWTREMCNQPKMVVIISCFYVCVWQCMPLNGINYSHYYYSVRVRLLTYYGTHTRRYSNHHFTAIYFDWILFSSLLAKQPNGNWFIIN